MLITGIAGGSGTGKTSILDTLKSLFTPGFIAAISMDWYYNETNHLSPDERRHINFDHPEAFEESLLLQHLSDLKNKKSVLCPVYSYTEMNRLSQTQIITPSPIIIVEGLYALLNDSLRENFDLSIYLTSTKSIRLNRVIERDTRSRNRTPAEIKTRFRNIVNPMHLEYVQKQKYLADYSVTNNEDKNSCALKIKNILSKHLEK